MDIKEYTCIDAGTENCPCYLALTGDCLTCSKLQGKDCSFCNWKGVCIYNEFIQNNKKINNARKNFETEILEMKDYGDDLVVFVLKVNRGFAIKCNKPGTYVFMGNSKLEDYYLTPISVMKSDTEAGLLYLAVKIISAKTKALLLSEKITLRGPYRNGVQGELSKGKNLILTKGIGIAPAIHMLNDMEFNEKVELMIDLEKININLIQDYISDDDIIKNKLKSIDYVTLADKKSYDIIRDKIIESQYDGVVILTSDYFIDLYSNLVKTILPQALIAVSNNVHICCGEGLCGACSKVLEDGSVIKLCKCHHNL